MLGRLVDFCTTRPKTTLGAVAVAFVAALATAQNLELDALPDVTGKQVVVLTSAPGLSPVEVEQQVTTVIEMATGSLPGVVEQRSLSRYGISSVTLIFDESTDLSEARQYVQEKLPTLVESLPSGVSIPEIGPLSGGLGEIFQFTVSSPTRDLAELLEIVRYDLGPVLRSIPGVVELNPWGGKERTLDVIVDPIRMSRYALTLKDVEEAVSASVKIQAGASIDTDGDGQAYLRGIVRPLEPRDLAQLTIRPKRDDSMPIRLADVARVARGHRLRLGAATRDGEGETVYVMLQMLRGANALEIAGRIHDALQTAKSLLPRDVHLEVTYDRSDLVWATIATVTQNLTEGGVLVIVVLFAFLGSLRAGLVVALVIPLSMLGALASMVLLGIPGNLMSLGAIDFGLLVDGAVVKVEGYFHGGASGLAWSERVRRCSRSVAAPVAVAVLIIILVYLPLLLLRGVDGALFRPMAATVVLALFTSLILALTYVPAASALFLRPKDIPEKEPWIPRWFRRIYEPSLEACLRRPALVGIGAAVLLAVGVALLMRLERSFVPQLDEGDLVIQTLRRSDSSIEGSIRGATRLEQAILPIPEVRHVASRIGSPTVATDIMGLEQADVFVDLAPKSEWRPGLTKERLREMIGERLAALDPRGDPAFTQPIQMRFNELIGGDTADVSVSVFGPDLLELRRLAESVRSLAASVTGADDVRISAPPEVLSIDVYPHPLLAGQAGLTADDVLRTVQAVEVGIEVARVYDGRVPVPVRIKQGSEVSSATIRQTPILTGEGELVPLSSVARVEEQATPSLVAHESSSRRIVVGFNVRGRGLGSVVAEVRELVTSRVDLPEGYRLEWGGQYQSLQDAQQRLLRVGPLALVLIAALLLGLFGSIRPALFVLTNIPIAAVGGLIALSLRGLPLSISAAVGFIALSGIAVLNGVVLFARILELEGSHDPVEIARTAAQSRMRPVLMTALVGSIGFLPMALNRGVGAEVQRPVATVVIGGLVTATLLTLLILPTLYAAIETRRKRPD